MSMKLKLALVAALIACAAVLLAGCSGAGAPANPVSSLQSVVQDNLSAVVLIASWSKILYVKVGDDLITPTKTQMPDGSTRVVGIYSDHGAYERFVMPADPEGRVATHGTITWPDGASLHQESVQVVSADQRHMTAHTLNTCSDGSSMEFDTDVTVRTHSRRVLDGTARTAEGITVDFHLDRVQLEQDVLTLSLPDGSHLSLTVPVTILAGGHGYPWPRVQEASTAQYTATDGSVLNITLKGTTTEAWDSWEIAAADGTDGSFSLGEDMAGNGQLRRDGQIVGALRWDADGVGTLVPIGGGQENLNPFGPARDFQMTHWISNVALLGPMPAF